MKVFQNVNSELVQSNAQDIIAGQIHHIRSLFNPTGLQRIAQTRDGVRYYASAETLFALAKSAPPPFSFPMIRLLGSVWYDAVQNEEARRNMEETLVSLCAEIMEKHCIEGTATI